MADSPFNFKTSSGDTCSIDLSTNYSDAFVGSLTNESAQYYGIVLSSTSGVSGVQDSHYRYGNDIISGIPHRTFKVRPTSNMSITVTLPDYGTYSGTQTLNVAANRTYSYVATTNEGYHFGSEQTSTRLTGSGNFINGDVRLDFSTNVNAYKYYTGTLPEGITSLFCYRKDGSRVYSGDTIYYWEELYWGYTLQSGYKIVNNTYYNAEHTLTVKGDVYGASATAIQAEPLTSTIYWYNRVPDGDRDVFPVYVDGTASYGASGSLPYSGRSATISAGVGNYKATDYDIYPTSGLTLYSPSQGGYVHNKSGLKSITKTATGDSYYVYQYEASMPNPYTKNITLYKNTHSVVWTSPVMIVNAQSSDYGQVSVSISGEGYSLTLTNVMYGTSSVSATITIVLSGNFTVVTETSY